MRDLKYRELLLTKNVRRDTALTLRSGEYLGKVSGDFFENIARIDSFCMFPMVVGAEAFQKQLWRSQAILKVTGTISLRKKTIDDKTAKAIAREMRRSERAYRKRIMSGHDDRDKRRMTVGLGHINEMLGVDFGANQSMEAILFSVVVQSWMAFEALAADLWVVALDYGPAEWSTGVGLKYKEFKKGSNFDPAVLPNPMPNLREKPGSFYKEGEMVSFSKLRFIKFWYKAAFNGKADNLFKSHRYINALSAVRNVIAHNAGRADAKYRKAVADFDELKRIGDNILIRLDGEIVRKLSNAAISLGHQLILFVDHGITPLPQKA